ncbi:histidine kinase [Aeromicrobium fastidiosum]|uniref:sensor histidine kinase n=1 Tax=Aeromicrobium fastidiosum TaxID=52699 RepID=UPI00202369C5|nr:histidine kinase [Aeromicrobium fastidiosum]MCL8250218.1 histidine kinase [Aeromicrobium fastidiosum]
MPSVTYQPPLRWWNHAWRYVLVVAISAISWFEIAPWQWDHRRWWFWTDLGLGVFSLVLLAWRRRHPFAVAVVVNAVTVVSWSSGGPATLALVSLATRRRWREVLPVATLGLVAGLALERMNPVSTQDFAFTIPFVAVVVAATVAWGMFIGSRRELIATLRERAETAEVEQASRVAQARTAERSRIAREMHDVLAHRISLVTMHAGALAYRDDLSRDEVRTTAGIIQDNSHRAMVELREVLGVLRDGPGDSAPERPQPSASDLRALVDEARASGTRVDLWVGVELADVPDALGRTAYRVVQEGLTNARKHAADTLVSVTLTGGPADGLTIEVRNPLRVGEPVASAPRSGLGLAGLAERAELAGGTLTHEVSPAAEFVLETWLPWPT